MAKFELSVYDMKTGEVVKVLRQNRMPVNLFLKFQELSEKIAAEKISSDAEMFKQIKPLFLETFPDLTDKEYLNCTDVAEVLVLLRDILNKSTILAPDDSKNA